MSEASKTHDITRFMYTKMLKNMMEVKRAEWMSLEKTTKQSMNIRLVRMFATEAVQKKIKTMLLSSDRLKRETGRQLELEKEYIRALEYKTMIQTIEKKTNNSANGIFTLAEIGDIFGLTRERVRQLEDSAIKVMKHPFTARSMREYLYEDMDSNKVG